VEPWGRDDKFQFLGKPARSIVKDSRSILDKVDGGEVGARHRGGKKRRSKANDSWGLTWGVRKGYCLLHAERRLGRVENGPAECSTSGGGREETAKIKTGDPKKNSRGAGI